MSNSIPKSAMAPGSVTTLATGLSMTSYTYHLCTYVVDYVLSSSRHWYIFFVQQSWQLYSNAWSTPLLTYWGTNFTYSSPINRTTSLPPPDPQSSAPPAVPFRLMELPDELLAAVLTQLPTSERARTSLVCRRFAALLATPAAWRTLTICTSRWSDLKEAKIDAWLARRASPHVLHLQLGSPHYRVRLRRPTLIAQLHGMLGSLQRVDVQHVEPFPAVELLQARSLQRASLRGAACAGEELRGLSREDVGASQLTSLTLHAPTDTAPAFPDFVLALHRLQRLSLAAPGETWRVPEELPSTLTSLTYLELAALDSLLLPCTLSALHTLRELRLHRVADVRGLQHVPATLRTLRTDGLAWSAGLERLVQRLTQLRVLVVRGSGRSEVLPRVLCSLPALETLVLEEDGGWGDTLSLTLDNLAPFTALRHVELAGSGQQLQVEGEQVCADSGVSRYTQPRSVVGAGWAASAGAL